MYHWGEPEQAPPLTQVLCHRKCANNYRENRKTHHCLPCHSEIHGLDYCTSLFVLCHQPCHSEIHSIDYSISLFVSCRWPCYGEIHGVAYRTSLCVSCHWSCCSVGYYQRRKTTKEERNVQVKKGPWNAWAKRGKATLLVGCPHDQTTCVESRAHLSLGWCVHACILRLTPRCC